LSHAAGSELIQDQNLSQFKQWLRDQDCYVFTLNGFPYGGFHHTIVKDNVHAPDWTTAQRADYTIRLAEILAALLPEGMEGGLSTSPLSYRHWHKTAEEKAAAFERSTAAVLQVVAALIRLKQTTGKTVHLDIEPEPDGLLESGVEFLQWYHTYLLQMGTSFLKKGFQLDKEDAEKTIKEHVQLCYDVCHFAVGYEDHAAVMRQLKEQGIKIGKIQISAALKAILPGVAERTGIMDAFMQFNEPVYLHQVIARKSDGDLKRYADLPDALKEAGDFSVQEWRAHYHVPLFIEKYGALQSTQKDIQEALRLHRQQPLTTHLEIETYTWEVLPQHLRLPLTESIIRELQWVLAELDTPIEA
jgi:hypothetical protein